RESPELAAGLKEQLVLNEWLSQRHAIDRQDFRAQVEQRVRDFELGEERLSQQVDDLRSLAERELRQFDARSRKARWQRFVGGLAALLLVGVGIGTWIMLTSLDGIEVLDYIRVPEGKLDNVGSHVKIGEPLITGNGEMVRLRYEDGTIIRIGANSSVEFQSGPGKQIIVRRGDVSAHVTEQHPDRPMMFKTRAAVATVLGTKLTVSVRAGTTWLDVTEGRVELLRIADKKKVFVNQKQIGHASAGDLSVSETLWPVDRSNLVFVFQTASQPNLVQDAATAAPRQCTVKARGAARLDVNQSLLLEGGAFVADDSEKTMYAAFRHSSEITIMATIRPEGLEQSGPARVISCATDTNRYNFMIGQKEDRLVAWFRTTGKDALAEIELSGLSIGEANHVVISYKPGRLVCYLNGEKFKDIKNIQIDFANWAGHPLVFGDDFEEGHPWNGTLEGIAIYNRFLDEDEVLANTAEYRQLIQSRTQ
ncbi:MAG: FecR domain-containing protein, partial [Planctomycetes bacterium]|nr:FecR domain-containing protein [Planctomycetota bacterium]